MNKTLALITSAWLPVVWGGMLRSAALERIQTEAGLHVARLTTVAASIDRLKSGSFQLLRLGIVEAASIDKQYGLHTLSSWAIAYPSAYALGRRELWHPLASSALQ